MTPTVEQKLSNILRNFHRNTPHPEADADDISAAIAAIVRVITPADAIVIDYEEIADEVRDAVGDNMAAGHSRINDLLEANNRYLERARAAEAELRRIKISLHDAHMAGGIPEEDR